MIRQFNTETPPPDADDHEHRLASAIRRRAEDIDRHVGARVRSRRVMLGLTQQQMAELIGVTVQHASKYETGASRIASGRLYRIAQALDIDLGYFFEGVGEPVEMKQQQRLLRGLARSFMAITDRRHQNELVSLARALAEPDVRAISRRVIWPG